MSDPRGRNAAGRGVRRRSRRCRRGRRQRHPGGASSSRRPGRRCVVGQPGGWADRDRDGAAVRVVIAEDSVLLAEGLKLILDTRGHEVVEVAEDAITFAEADERHTPDLAIVDVRLPPNLRDEGIHAALRARDRHEGLPVLVLSQYVEQDYAGELLSDGRGGVGYLLKDRIGRVGEFVDALDKVAGGGTVMDPAVVQQLL